VSGSVELAARTSGLLPMWLFLALFVFWILVTARLWHSRPEGSPELPFSLMAIGSLTLANVLFFWRPLFTEAHMPQGGGDLNSFFFTLHSYSAERVTSGEFPLWNPHLHGGMPHLGNFQAGFLYPPNLIAYLVAQPFSYGTLEWLAILHYLVASVGTYLLLRALGAGRIGAVAGGLIFAYGGFFVAHLGHYSMISSAAWIPWLLWAVHRLLVLRTWWAGAVLAVLTFLTATAGHQQTLLFALGGIALWWAFLTAAAVGMSLPGVGPERREDANDRRGWSLLWSRNSAISVIQFVVGIGTGLLLAAPMLLPSLQLARRSVRATLSIEQASEFSVQPVALLQLILPTVFGSNPTDYWGAFSSGEIWGYVGVTTLVIAALGVVLRPSPHRLFFSGVALFALLYAVGPAAPIHGWFYQFVPGFDLVRAPARAYVYLNLAVAVLAGLAVSDFARRVAHPGLHWQRAVDRGIRTLVIIIGVTSLFIIPFFYTQILGVNDPSNRPVITVDNLWIMLLFLGLLLGVLWLMRTGMLREAALGIVLTLVLVLDLFSATMPFNPTDEDLVAGYRDPEVTDILSSEWDAQDPFRIDVQHPGLLPNFGSTHGLHIATGVFDPMQPAAYAAMHNVLVEEPEHPAYDLLNVRYWLVPADADPVAGFDPVFEGTTGTQLWERPSALPRAWFVGQVEAMPYGAQLDALRDEDFDPSTTVLIENPPQTPEGANAGTVEIIRYEPEHITLDVDADGEGYVVISEGVYPGWAGEIDGEPITLLTANYGIRAVPVDENTQRVDLTYQPGFVTAGLIAAGLGGLLLLGMLAGPLTMSRVPSKRLEG
jgi:hypothetical protein